MATITGSNNADNLDGTIFDDVISGLAGNDIVNARLGKDKVNGGFGNDVIQGDGGDDNLLGEGDNDRLEGGGGKDILNGGSGIDTVVYTGNNNDIIIALGSPGRFGDAEGDTYVSIENVDVSALNDRATVFGDNNANTLTGGNAGDGLVGSGGNDIVRGRGGDDQLQGSTGDDLLEGGAGRDDMDGGAGFDLVSYVNSTSGVDVDLSLGSAPQGFSIFDEVDEPGGDILRNIEGIIGSNVDDGDFLTGDANDNIFFALGGDNFLTGRDGNDTYVVDLAIVDAVTFINEAKSDGSAASNPGDNDILRTQLNLIDRVSNTGIDLLIFNDPPDGSKGTADVFIFKHFAGAPVEKLFDTTTGTVVTLGVGLVGGNAPGIIAGTDEAGETIDGAGGDDLLFGNGGDDTLIGGKGKDLLDGGTGNDTITGGSQSDRFVFRPGDGNDVIPDFTASGKNADKLDLSDFGFEDPADVLACLAGGNGGAVLTLGEGQTITFTGLSPSTLTAANLILTAEG